MIRLQDMHIKLVIPQPSDVVPLKNWLYSFRARLIDITLSTLVHASRKEDTHPILRAIRASCTQLAKMSVDEIFDLTARVYFKVFLIIYDGGACMYILCICVCVHVRRSSGTLYSTPLEYTTRGDKI